MVRAAEYPQSPNLQRNDIVAPTAVLLRQYHGIKFRVDHGLPTDPKPIVNFMTTALSSNRSDLIVILFEVIRERAPELLTSHMYSLMCRGSMRMGRHEEAVRIGEEGLSRGMLDIVVYTNLISAYGKAGRPEMSLDVFRRIQENGKKPDVFVYNSLLGSLVRNRRFQDCARVIHQMRSDGIEADDVSAWQMFSAYMSLGDSDVRVLLEKIEGLKRECSMTRVAFFYIRACRHFLNQGRLNEAIACAGVIACDPEEHLPTEVVNALLRLARSDSKVFLQLWQSFQEWKVELNAISYSMYLDALSPSADGSQVLECLENIVQQGIHIDQFLIAKLLSIRRIARSRDVVYAIERYVFSRPKEHLDSITYQSFCRAYAECNDLEKVSSMFRIMTRLELETKPNFISYIISYFCRNDSFEDVCSAVRYAQMNGIELEDLTCRRIINLCAIRYSIIERLSLRFDIQLQKRRLSLLYGVLKATIVDKLTDLSSVLIKFYLKSFGRLTTDEYLRVVLAQLRDEPDLELLLVLGFQENVFRTASEYHLLTVPNMDAEFLDSLLVKALPKALTRTQTELVTLRFTSQASYEYFLDLFALCELLNSRFELETRETTKEIKLRLYSSATT